MKSISTGIAVLSIVLGAGALAPSDARAATGNTTVTVLGLGGELVQQSPSAPGCMRNPPPSQCKVAPLPESPEESVVR
jgi:hypothetical protein